MRVEVRSCFAGGDVSASEQCRPDRDRISSIACAPAAIRSRRAATNFSPGWRTCSSTRGCLSQPVSSPLQEIVEEALLQLAAVVGVEMRPVLDAVRLEPFLLARRRARSPRNCRADAGPGRPSWPPTRTAPHLGPVRRAVLVVLVVERMRADLAAEIAAVLARAASSDSVSGPQTSSPCTRLRLPLAWKVRSPAENTRR